MMEAQVELSAFFDAAELNNETYTDFADHAYTSARTFERFTELVNEYAQRAESGMGDALKAGVGYLILGRYQQALDWLEKAGDGKYKHFYAGRALAGLIRYPDARDAYAKAAGAGWDAFETDMAIAALHVQEDHLDEAAKLVEAHNADGTDRADWYYVRGLIAEKNNEHEEALDLYDKAVTLDPDHAACMFRAAWVWDLRGVDDRAIEFYQQLVEMPRAHINALINLAVIYEDAGKFDEAATYLQRVLTAYPNHTRAQLFLKDVESSREMVIDDTIEKQVETRNRLLETPISEFELSVRARNCLKKMNIQTLGDLLKLTEAELLSYKNFGETSLQEINALLNKKGLRLGQRPEDIDATALLEQAAPAPAARINVPPGSEALLTKPVSEMELSVRARRCLQRLNIERLGDLIQHTEAELLATRNFGVTSLNEIKARLTEYGLALASKS